MKANQLGLQAEQRAQRYLEKQGFRVVAKNYRSSFGEIDLIVLNQAFLVFVEVRLRTQRNLVSAKESVDWRKQKRIINTAKQFLARNPEFNSKPARFDVIALNSNDPKSPIEWIQNAFQADGYF